MKSNKLKNILNLLKSKKEAFSIESFVLFGSLARGEERQESDVDIAYILKDGYKMSFDRYLRLEEELSKKLNRDIDLVNFDKLNPLIKLNTKDDFLYV